MSQITCFASKRERTSNKKKVSSLKLCSIVLIVVMIIFHHKGAWSMFIFTAFSVVARHIHTFIFLLFVVIMAFEHFWKVVCTVETRFRKTLIFFSLSVLALAVFIFSHHLFCTTRATEGQPSFFFAEFVSACLPAWAKAHHQASLSASTTIHHQAGVREGAGVGGGARGGRYGRGPVMGQSLPLTPPFLLHKLLRIQASATDSSHTPLLQPLQWGSKFIQGRRDLLPSFAPLLLHPCLLPLLFSSFISCLSPSFLGSSPLPSTLLPWSLSSPHWGVIPPTLFH